MDTGFGQNLEGFLIKGNLSLSPSTIPDLYGDGSIEGSGTLYIDYIQEYNPSNGVDIQRVKFKGEQLTVPYTASSTNISSGAIVVEGGISIKNSTQSTSVTSGGALTIAGGASIKKNVNIGGILNVNENKIINVALPTNSLDATNKEYVDSVAGRVSGNFTTGQIIIADSNGDSIKGSDSFKFIENNLFLDVPFILGDSSNATGKTSGSLIVYGGISVEKDVYFSGVLDLGNNLIKNVANPIASSDVATKEYVDNNKIQSNFTSGQVIIGGIDNEIIGYSSLIYDGITLSIIGTSNIIGSFGGAFVCYGGVTIAKDVFIGGTITMDGYSITGVAEPIQPSDVATKNYVDSKTYGNIIGNFEANQLITGSSDGNSLTSYPSLSFDGEYLTLGTVASFIIENTQTGNSLTEETSIVTYGGASIYKNLYVGGKLDVNNNNITNLAYPINQSDAATKQYVDEMAETGGIEGNFTAGQILIADSNGDAIRGFDSFTFNSTTGTLVLNGDIYINNTTNSTGLGSGGSFTTLGGASFEKDVFIGGVLDVNNNRITSVDNPIANLDAVNKYYVDKKINEVYASGCGCVCQEQSYLLINNILVPEDIPNFRFDDTVKAFISNVFIDSNGTCGLYSIHGIKCNEYWSISTIFTGKPTGVNFSIRDEDGDGIMQYTNRNTYGTTSIKFSTILQIDDVGLPEQINYTLSGNVIEQQDISQLTFNNNECDAVKLIVYISSETDNKHGMYLSNCVLKGDEWFMNTHLIGTITGIHFNIKTENDTGIIQYTNTNIANDYIIRAQIIKISNQEEIILNSNTLVPTLVNNINLTFDNNDNHFQLSVFVTVPELNKYALHEIRGVVCNDNWTINTRYIGDYTGIKFFIDDSTTGFGKLSYTNSNNNDAIIKFINNAPLASLKPLSVNKGGTGSSYLSKNAVLRGNGIEPIFGTSDFVYENYKLILGNVSSIILQNTESPTNLTTGGSLISYGGVSINKDLLVGENLIVNDVDITPNSYDIIAEKTFYANNNQIINDDVTGFYFGGNTKSFNGIVCITITNADGDEQDCLFELKGLKKKAGWIINSNYIGDSLGIKFNIKSDGQVTYTSINSPNWISTKMKFKALTTTF